MMGDCLLECLKEARLDRYYPNFIQRGLKNCESLVDLSMQDYPRYGVVSMEDRLHLFKLIQIIKSVQAEGVVCRHKGQQPQQQHHQLQQQQQQQQQQHYPTIQNMNKEALMRGLVDYASATNFSNFAQPQPQRHSLFSGQTRPDVPRGASQAVPLRNTITREVVVKEQVPVSSLPFLNGSMAPSHSQHQQAVPIHTKHHEQQAAVIPANQVSKLQGRPLFREKPLFEFDKVTKKSPEVVFKKGSDSPVFKCRKTLKFSDSDLESDSEDEAFVTKPCQTNNPVTIDTHQQKTVHVTKPAPVQSAFESDRPISPVSKSTLARAKSKDIQPTSPRAFFIDVETKSVNNHNTSRESSSRDSMASSSSRIYHHSVQTNPHRQAPIIQSKEPAVEHAYFPTNAHVSSEQQTVTVQKVIHGNGYNYGVPSSQNADKVSPSSCSAVPVTDKIKVCVRKRPLTVKEVKRRDMDIVKTVDSTTLAVDEPKLSVDLNKYIQQHLFTFDEVFDNTVSNEEMYKRAVKPLVRCLFNRGTATCFAFGQTGAGKTYTLLGSKTVPGMYRLAAQDIFHEIQHAGQTQAKDNLPRYALWISYYEIYCGQLFDLLNKRKKLQVRENGKQKVCLTGLTETQAKDIRSLVQIIQYGNLARSTGSTGANTHSSRSHAILQLELRDHKDSKIGRMTFIDLAGSERASDVTDYDRQTRTEGAEINQSLLALKECIRSIDQDSKHTPYRQSKLTHILRDSFLGNSQTVMIANVAPTQSACENTLNTLRYADRVKELRKNNGNRSVSSKSSPQLKANPQVSTKTPVNKKIASLFHPSKIQYSSTPKQKNSPETGDGDLSRVLQEAYESPITGHRMQFAGAKHLNGSGKSTASREDTRLEQGTVTDHVNAHKGDVNNNNNSHHKKELLSKVFQHQNSSGSDSSTAGSSSHFHKRYTGPGGAITLERVISNVSHIVGASAIANKDPDTGRAEKSNGPALIPTGEQTSAVTAPTTGPPCFCKSSDSQKDTESRKQSKPHIFGVNPDSKSNSSGGQSSPDDVIQEHEELLSHLDHVLDKAKNVILNTTPRKHEHIPQGTSVQAAHAGEQNSGSIFGAQSQTRERSLVSEFHSTHSKPNSRSSSLERRRPLTEQERIESLLLEGLRRERSQSRESDGLRRSGGMTKHSNHSTQSTTNAHTHDHQQTASNHSDSTGSGSMRNQAKHVKSLSRRGPSFANSEKGDWLKPKALFLQSESPSSEEELPRYSGDLQPDPATTGSRGNTGSLKNTHRAEEQNESVNSTGTMHRSDLDLVVPSVPKYMSSNKQALRSDEANVLISSCDSDQLTRRPGTPNVSAESLPNRISYGNKTSRDSSSSSVNDKPDFADAALLRGISDEDSARIIPSGRLSNPVPGQSVLIDSRRATTPDTSIQKDHSIHDEFVKSLTESQLARRMLVEHLDQEKPAQGAHFDHGNQNQFGVSVSVESDRSQSGPQPSYSLVQEGPQYSRSRRDDSSLGFSVNVHHKMIPGHVVYTAAPTRPLETEQHYSSARQSTHVTTSHSSLAHRTQQEKAEDMEVRDSRDSSGRSWADLLSQSSNNSRNGSQTHSYRAAPLSSQDSGLSTMLLGNSHLHTHENSDSVYVETSNHGQVSQLGMGKGSAFTVINQSSSHHAHGAASLEILQNSSSNNTDTVPLSGLQQVSKTKVKENSPVTSAKLKAASEDAGAAFAPIQPCPVTPRDKREITVPSVITKTVLPSSDRAEGDGRETLVRRAGPTQSPAANTCQAASSSVPLDGTTGVDSPLQDSLEGSTHQNTLLVQDQLIVSHEEQLSEVIALCKQEMKLLLSIRNGTTNFDHYITEVEQIMCSKAQHVANLLSQIDQVARMCAASPQV